MALLRFLIAAWLLLASIVSAQTTQAAMSIAGSGASFPGSLYIQLAQDFTNAQTQVQVTYSPTSSGNGRRDLVNTTLYQFIGSDNIPAVSFPSSYTKSQTALLPFPAVFGGIAVVYNLNGLTNTPLVLTRKNIADIFSGAVQMWNDASLTGQNPALSAVNQRIQLVVRGGSSGTTSNFLTAVNKFAGTQLFDSTATNGTFPTLATLNGTNAPYKANTNADMGVIVGTVEYTMAYMDYSDAILAQNLSSSIQIASIVNKAGQTITPSLANFVSTISKVAIDIDPSGSLVSMSSVINNAIMDLSDPGSYPMMAASYYMVRADSAPYGVSIDLMRATMRYLWWTLFNGTETDAAAVSTNAASTTSFSRFQQLNFIHIPIGVQQVSYSIMKTVTHNGVNLFDSNSVCNPSFDANGNYLRPNSCQNGGTCLTNGPFQDSSSAVCICPVGFVNSRFKDCSEPATFFSLPSDDGFKFNLIALILMAIATVFILVITALMVIYRDRPKIRAIAPSCCWLILAGCLLGVFGGFVYTVVPQDPVCRLRPFLPTIGFALVFGMLLLKTYRIYTIFGYKRVTATIIIPNWKLITITFGLAAVQAVICIIWVFVVQPTAVPLSFGTQVLITCQPSANMVIADRWFQAIVFVFNGIILVGCLILALQTRGAHERFQESKAISLSVYTVSITLLFGLPIIYGLPSGTDATLFKIANFIRTMIMIIISIGIPSFLYVPRLYQTMFRTGNGSDMRGQNGILGADPDSGSFSGDDGASRRSMESWSVQAITFDVGVQGMKVGGAWTSASLVVLPEMDLLVFLDSIQSGKTLVSFKISSTDCQRMLPNGSVSRATDISTKRIALTAPQLKKAYHIEFVNESRAVAFLNVMELVQSRSQSHNSAVPIGQISNVGAYIDTRKNIASSLQQLTPNLNGSPRSSPRALGATRANAADASIPMISLGPSSAASKPVSAAGSATALNARLPMNPQMAFSSGAAPPPPPSANKPDHMPIVVPFTNAKGPEDDWLELKP
ncbi:uncharacterized protein BJ171DRAFT_634457 [Polychytrium aggregatum]|uniref:uncharacterized protein n=1 Tax=Polychytrium aggregatum TaxID=110093 RepID=UPI0022FE29B5|nr:uncharacterized protein BJ171DRAFT_634457 [Polychytrium aggregatum]KAI9197117.1 hypothetical protein BJ171DRAFT_634457 [Polychytrium aggregatum]